MCVGEETRDRFARPIRHRPMAFYVPLLFFIPPNNPGERKVMSHSSSTTTLSFAHWLNSIYAFSCFCSSHFSSSSLSPSLSFDGSTILPSSPFEKRGKKKKKIATAVPYHHIEHIFPLRASHRLPLHFGLYHFWKRVGPSVSRVLAVVFDWHPALERRRLCVCR